jgi:hypothetical protein
MTIHFKKILPFGQNDLANFLGCLCLLEHRGGGAFQCCTQWLCTAYQFRKVAGVANLSLKKASVFLGSKFLDIYLANNFIENDHQPVRVQVECKEYKLENGQRQLKRDQWQYFLPPSEEDKKPFTLCCSRNSKAH